MEADIPGKKGKDFDKQEVFVWEEVTRFNGKHAINGYGDDFLKIKGMFIFGTIQEDQKQPARTVFDIQPTPLDPDD